VKGDYLIGNPHQETQEGRGRGAKTTGREEEEEREARSKEQGVRKREERLERSELRRGEKSTPTQVSPATAPPFYGTGTGQFSLCLSLPPKLGIQPTLGLQPFPTTLSFRFRIVRLLLFFSYSPTIYF
jgi:hypothetical protein